MDCRLPDVRRQLEADISALPGTEVANVWYWANPCTTFCAWNLWNGGSRSFTEPLGQGNNQAELDANEMTEWTATQLCAIQQ